METTISSVSKRPRQLISKVSPGVQTVLVPTDFSACSRHGIQFAIHWATQQNLELVFIHVLNSSIDVGIADLYDVGHEQEQENKCLVKLEAFISGIYTKMGIAARGHSFVVIQGFSAAISILDYCMEHPNIDYVCMSTRGAGRFKKVFGTNTGTLVTKSNVPVLAVPKNYRPAEINKVLYATDLQHYSEELKKVIAFASPLKAEIEVFHLTWPYEVSLDEQLVRAAFKKRYKYKLEVLFEKNDAVHSVAQMLERQVRISKPSIVVMFTDKERTLFERIFLSSTTEKMTYHPVVPILAFNRV